MGKRPPKGERPQDRHDRETIAKVARTVGVSRETLRQVRYLHALAAHDPERYGHLPAAMRDGTLSLQSTYDQIRGDKRRPLYVKLDPKLLHHLTMEAEYHSITRTEMLAAILTHRYAEVLDLFELPDDDPT